MSITDCQADDLSLEVFPGPAAGSGVDRRDSAEGVMRSAILILGLVLAASSAGAGQSPRDTTLSRELLERLRIDQAIRDTFVLRLQAGQPVDSAVAARMAAIDSANTTWLKAVVARRGWPGRSAVGTEASSAAFLIVQHAVHDSAFQAQALSLMERGVATGEVRGADVAMLADRVAVHRGQPQRYGTQARLLDGRMVLDPIADSAHVDERRAALGMPPLREYVRLLDSMYTAHPAPR
jgi:hypothetical protein